MRGGCRHQADDICNDCLHGPYESSLPTCDLPDAHEGLEEAQWCFNLEHSACVAGTVGCSAVHAVDEDCATY